MDITTVSNMVDIGINVFAIIGGSAVTAAFIPKPSDKATAVFNIIRKLVDFVGANWFNAKNSE